MLARGGGSWLFLFSVPSSFMTACGKSRSKILIFFFALVRSRPVLKDNAGGSPRGAAELTAREGSFASYGASARSFVR